MSTQLAKIFKNNKAFQATMPQTVFDTHHQGQEPDFLFLACSDSRVTPSIITNSQQGELFECRNVANQANPNSDDWLSVLEYAVFQLKVKHIVVCGHTNCGGVQTAMAVAESDKVLPQSLPAISRYLKPIIELYQENQEELSQIEDKAERVNALVRLNVQQQVNRVSTCYVIEQAQQLQSEHVPQIHGAIYDIGSGHLQILDEHGATLKKALDEHAIEAEIQRLQDYAKSYNPFKWLGAQAKSQAISAALEDIQRNDKAITCELENPESALYQALNSKRLLSFSLGSWGNGLFSAKSTALSNAELEVSQTQTTVPSCCHC